MLILAKDLALQWSRRKAGRLGFTTENGEPYHGLKRLWALLDGEPSIMSTSRVFHNIKVVEL
jgi:hypothetical protein